MKRNNMIALSSLFVTIIIWVIEIINPSVKFFLAAILSTIISICFGVVCIVNKISENISPYFVFGVTDVIIGILITIYSLYDMYINREKLLGGLFGYILLSCVVPGLFVLFVIDVLLWIKNRRKKFV